MDRTLLPRDTAAKRAAPGFLWRGSLKGSTERIQSTWQDGKRTIRDDRRSGSNPVSPPNTTLDPSLYGEEGQDIHERRVGDDNAKSFELVETYILVDSVQFCDLA